MISAGVRVQKEKSMLALGVKDEIKVKMIITDFAFLGWAIHAIHSSVPVHLWCMSCWTSRDDGMRSHLRTDGRSIGIYYLYSRLVQHFEMLNTLSRNYVGMREETFKFSQMPSTFGRKRSLGTGNL